MTFNIFFKAIWFWKIKLKIKGWRQRPATKTYKVKMNIMGKDSPRQLGGKQKSMKSWTFLGGNRRHGLLYVRILFWIKDNIRLRVQSCWKSLLEELWISQREASQGSWVVSLSCLGKLIRGDFLLNQQLGKP